MKKTLFLFLIFASVMFSQRVRDIVLHSNEDNIFNTMDHLQYDVISYFDGGIGTEWTGTGNNDTEYHLFSTQGIRMQATTATLGITKTLSTPIDMSNKRISLLFYYHSDLPSMPAIQLFAYSGASYYQLISIIDNSASIINGWNYIDVPKSFFSTSGAPSWSNITKFLIRINSVANPYVFDVTFNGLFAVENNLDKGTVVFTFDDRDSSQYTQAYSYMQTKGFPGTAFIYHTGGSITVPQLQEMKAGGWELAGHDSPTLTGLSANAVDSLFVVMKNYLVNNGLAGKYLTYAYPGGGYDSTVMSLCSKYYSFGRVVGSSFSNNLPISQYDVNAKSYSGNAYATAAPLVDLAETNKEIIIFAFHKIGVGGTPIADFQQLVDYVATKNVTVKTFIDAMTSRQ